MSPILTSETIRFILTSIPSVTNLEGLLLLRGGPSILWSVSDVASRLYVSNKVAQDLLEQLCAMGAAACVDKDSFLYQYRPLSEMLKQQIDQLALAYPGHLLEITRLIHSKSDSAAQQFADAFKLRRDD